MFAEVKDEYKQMEGDPQVKGQRRNMARQMSMNRMMLCARSRCDCCQKSDHFRWWALKYDMDLDTAPIVVAKGQDYSALKIVEVVAKNGVPIKENKPLARGLYEMVEINDTIPAELYKAVAELLAWFTAIKKRRKNNWPRIINNMVAIFVVIVIAFIIIPLPPFFGILYVHSEHFVLADDSLDHHVH